MSGLVIAGHRVPGWAPVAAAGVVGVALYLRARSASAASTDPLAGAGITAADLAGGVGPPLPGYGADTTGGAPASPVGSVVPAGTPGAGSIGTIGLFGGGAAGCFEPWLYPAGSPCNPRGLTGPPQLIGPGPTRAG